MMRPRVGPLIVLRVCKNKTRLLQVHLCSLKIIIITSPLALTLPMRRRGPTVPRSSAKLADSEPCEGDAVIISTWRLSLSTGDASTATDPISKTHQRLAPDGCC